MNSGITSVGVLTQYRPRSLNDHIGIGRPWDLDRQGGGVTLLQPYLGRESSDWYRGTADAVAQNIYYLEETRAEIVLILAGDHVYKMNYDDIITFHFAAGADVTVPLYQVPMDEAHRYGVLTTDEDHRIIEFDEKPKQPKSNLISMGIYCFNRRALIDQLIADSTAAHDVIARLRARHHSAHDGEGGMKVFGYPFDGYWRDVGTIESYYDGNMDLLEDLPELNLYDPDTRIHTRVTEYPPAKVGRARVHLAVAASTWAASSTGTSSTPCSRPGVFVEEGAVVRDSIIFDDTRIDAGAIVNRSIVDKEVLVDKNAYVGYGDDMSPNRDRPDILDCGITDHRQAGEGAGVRAHRPQLRHRPERDRRGSDRRHDSQRRRRCARRRSCFRTPSNFDASIETQRHRGTENGIDRCVSRIALAAVRWCRRPFRLQHRL